jgi:hypothetical protein
MQAIPNESFSRNLHAINLLASHSPRNRLISNRLLLNHLLCKFSLWPPHNNPLTHPSTAKGMAGGGGWMNKQRTKGDQGSSPKML